MDATTGAPSADVVVCAEQLRKSYGATLAIADVSLTVHQGEILGLVGPNGAGKTTTIECLEGQRRPDAGVVRVFGQNPWNNRLLRERIGIQLQGASVARRIKVWEALDLFASFYRRSTDREPLLEQLGLADKRDAFVGQLSGGQKQRLFVALALVNDPDLLFLDELTSGLDPQARHRVWDLVRSIRDRGKTLVLTTHFMEEAERLCDRVAILDHGRVLAFDSPDRLTSAAGLGGRIEFTTTDAFDRRLISHVSGIGRIDHADGRVTVYGADGIAGQVMLALERSQCPYWNLRVMRASLEDVFLSLTGRQLRD